MVTTSIQKNILGIFFLFLDNFTRAPNRMDSKIPVVGTHVNTLNTSKPSFLQNDA